MPVRLCTIPERSEGGYVSGVTVIYLRDMRLESCPFPINIVLNNGELNRFACCKNKHTAKCAETMSVTVLLTILY
jgi:hypothetical protein